MGTVGPLPRNALPGNALDVLVVGAGPAGVATGIEARRLGLDVLMVDKAGFPRDKTCGDGLTTAALRLIEQLGVDLRTLPGYMAVRETVLVGPDGRRVSLPLTDDGDHAAVVPRVELDAAIVDTARRSGVEVRDGVAVSGIDMNGDGEAVTATTADGDSVRARFLIAADGHYSFVRRCLRPPAPPELGTWHAFRQYFRGVDDPRLYVLFEADLLPGYAWVFPLPEGRANVGFGVLRRPGMSGKELNARWRELLDEAQGRSRQTVPARLVAGERGLVDDQDVEAPSPGSQAGGCARRPGTHHEDIDRRRHCADPTVAGLGPRSLRRGRPRRARITDGLSGQTGVV